MDDHLDANHQHQQQQPLRVVLDEGHSSNRQRGLHRQNSMKIVKIRKATIKKRNNSLYFQLEHMESGGLLCIIEGKPR